MGTSLTGKQIKNTYKSLIKVSDNTEASASAKQLSDGNGNDFGVYIDTDGVFGIGSAPSYSLDVSSRTDAVALPVGTTANRPTGFNGLIRYNSTIGKVEFYDTGWKTIFTTSGGTISGSVTITGDLTVQGDNTIIEAQTVEVEDNILNLNRTQGTPDTATATTSGISIYRGDGVTEASFIFDDSDDTWDLTNNLVIAGTLQSSSYTDGTATLTGGTLSGAVLADGVTATTQANSDNSTKVATTAYVKSVVTLEDLDFAGGTGEGSVDLDSQTFTIAGTANEIETTASGQTLTIGLPDDVTITGDLTVDTNTLYVDSTNNRVGVGTVSPSYNLDFGTGTANLATIGTSDAALRLRADGARSLQLYTNSAERLRIDSSGSIISGYGTTLGNYQFTGSAYKIEGGSGLGDMRFTAPRFRFYDGVGNPTINIASGNVGIGTTSPDTITEIAGDNPILTIRDTDTSSSTATATIRFAESGAGGTLGNYWDVGYSPVNLLNFDYMGSTKMTIDSTGNVGIGTDSPAEKLEVSESISLGTERTSSPTQGDAKLILKGKNLNSGGTYYGDYGQILFSANVNFTGSARKWLVTNALDAYKFAIINGGASVATPALGDSGALTTGTAVFVIDETKVGIGTTSPSVPLTVQSNSGGIATRFLGRSSDGYSFLTFRNNADSATNGEIGISDAQNMLFYTGATERLRIDSSGRVLIDSTTAYPNSVTTGAYLVAINDGVYWAAHFAADSTSSRDVVAFSNPNGKIGAINTNGTTTSYETSSDYRLKENVVEMTDALDRVDALKPSRFNFIADPNKTVDGFLAHEVADVVPEAISGTKDEVDDEGNPVYQGIDQSKLVPLLVGAIQELRAEIETLKSQINP